MKIIISNLVLCAFGAALLSFVKAHPSVEYISIWHILLLAFLLSGMIGVAAYATGLALRENL